MRLKDAIAAAAMMLTLVQGAVASAQTAAPAQPRGSGSRSACRATATSSTSPIASSRRSDAARLGGLSRHRRRTRQAPRRRDHRHLAQEPRRRQPVLGPHHRHHLRSDDAGLGRGPVQADRPHRRPPPAAQDAAALVSRILGGLGHDRRRPRLRWPRPSRSSIRSVPPRKACPPTRSGSGSAPTPISSAATSGARRSSSIRSPRPAAAPIRRTGTARSSAPSMPARRWCSWRWASPATP